MSGNILNKIKAQSQCQRLVVAQTPGNSEGAPKASFADFTEHASLTLLMLRNQVDNGKINDYKSFYNNNLLINYIKFR